MWIVTIIFAIIACGSTIFSILYRRQIQEVCRQLAFLKKHESNMLITNQIQDKSIEQLSDEINHLLQEKKKMQREYQRRNEQWKEAITNLSHDIRTPLTSLDGYFQLLMESEDFSEREKYTQIIRGRIKSLKDMLEELFTYTKLQNNVYEFKVEPYNLNQILYDTLFSFYEDFKSRKIEPHIEIIEEPIEILCDETALKRVFQNVIKNGLEHGQDTIFVCMEKKRDRVQIVFRNPATYENIDLQEIINAEQFFERFYKADDARSQNSTGLGLSIAKELILKMNGSIFAKYENNEFTITIEFQLHGMK